MVAITGSSYGYPGTIDAQQWAEAQPGLGERYWVESASAAKVTALGSAARTVRISAGRIAGHGVFDILTSSVDLELPNPSSGTVYYTVVARRTWQTSNATTIEAVAGTNARAVAVARNTTPGVIDDQPLALVAVTKDQNDVVVSDDLRCVGSKGDYEATSELVLSTVGYMDKPSNRIRIAGIEWLRTMAGTWERVEFPITTSSGIIATYQDGWNADAPGTSYMVRDGRRRSMFLELRRQGSSIAVGSTGSIANHSVRQLDEQDRPAYSVVAAGLYRNSGGADYGCTLQINPNGHVFLVHATPNADITYMEPGNWSLRVYATWYTA